MADAASLISMAAALEDPAERDSVHGTSSTRPPTRQQVGASTTAANDGQQPAGEAATTDDNNPDRVILTPTKLRVDSRVVVVHTTAQWLTNVFFVLFLLWKVSVIHTDPRQSKHMASYQHSTTVLQLRGDVDWTWWTIFAPMWINHLIHIPLQLVVLYYAVSTVTSTTCTYCLVRLHDHST